MADIKNYRCTVSMTLDVIGGKWKPLILWHLSFKTLRFSQLQRRLAKGMVHRQIYAEVPPRVEYSLTEQGQSVVPILEMMCQWGKDYLQANTGEEAPICQIG